VRSSDLVIKEWLNKILGRAIADHWDLIIRSNWIVAEDGSFAVTVESCDDIVYIVRKEASKND